MEGIRKSYSSVLDVYRRYWRIYGGWKDFLFSPYLFVSILFTIVVHPLWLPQGVQWWDLTLSVMPNVLGFSLGGFAIWLGFGDSGFQRFLASKKLKSKFSAFATLNATFVHFIIFQFISIALALLGKSQPMTMLPAEMPPCITCPSDAGCRETLTILSQAGAAVGMLSFVYALATAVAATMAIFRMTFLFEAFVRSQKQREKVEKMKNRFRRKLGK